MGLFRRKAKKDRDKAAADVPMAQTTTVEADVEVARREVAAEERPNPDQPGWGMTIGQEIGRGRQNRPGQG